MAKMNCTSLYVTTNQIILKSNPNNPNTWQDLYRLVPYLRNSLCCVVCGNLLVDPLTPSLGKCQHHLCKKCKGGRKKIKPTCAWCKDCKTYNENKHLRILLQCYKKMCITLINSGIFRGLVEQATKNSLAVGVERGAGNLIMIIKEGAAFEDEYQSDVALTKSAYNILPCLYTNSSTQTLQLQSTPVDNTKGLVLNANLQNVSNRSSLYSVMYAGTGNKITIKRKPKETCENKTTNKGTIQMRKDTNNKKPLFKKPPAKLAIKQRRGCRCGNATATPGKLTCCGQRCPCYVESKACIECKCRGCRNPHTPDGSKVRPLLPNLQHLQYDMQSNQNQQTLLQGVNIQLDANLTLAQFNEHFKSSNLKVIDKFPKVSPSLPQAILMSELSEEEDDEITVDV